MARREGLLNQLADELGNNVYARCVDVADTKRAQAVLMNLIEGMGGVDLIVISAGTGQVNNNLDWPPEQETIGTNVEGFTALAVAACHHFTERGTGHLVGISSIAALRGGRESPAYNASKAFESNYMEGLRQKFKKLKIPITVTDVKPGFVDTAMAKGDGIFWSAPPAKAAKQIFRAIERRKSKVYITKRWRLIAWLLRLIPSAIYERL